MKIRLDTERSTLLGAAAVLAFVVPAALLAGCAGDDGVTDPGPPARSYRVSVSSPNGAEGAGLIRVGASGVSSVEPTATQLFSRESGGDLRVLLLRATPGELAFRLELEEGAELPEIRLLQVAGPENRLRDLAGYRVETARE